MLKDPDRHVRSLVEHIYGKENVYVEIHDHGLEPQRKITPGLLKLAKEFGLKPVAATGALSSRSRRTRPA